MTTEDNYIQNTLKLFTYYKSLGDNTFAQMKDADFFYSTDDRSNSIAIIIQHIAGNMLSRWTDFLESDGEKEWRDRDQEFELYLEDKAACIQKWEDGWQCLFAALNLVDSENLSNTIYIRSKGHTVLEAINRQLAHYAYHIGQLVYIGRSCVDNWNSLSIAKGTSESYNKKSFGEGQRMEHFTDEFNPTNKKK